MDVHGWRFVVRDSCRITRRGVAAFGDLSGTLERSGLPALLDVQGEARRIERVDVEHALFSSPRREEIALVLVEADDLVPPGAVLSGPVD